MTVVVRGTNLAALVCALELVDSGIQTKLQIHRDSRLGGHFAGLQLAGSPIDIGMVLLEPRFSSERRSVSEYQGESGVLVNDFNHAVFQWLENLGIELDEVEVRSIYKGLTYDDVVISDALSVFSVLDLSVEEKAGLGNVSGQIHPRNKTVQSVEQMSLREALPKFYGPSISSFLAGIAKKIAGPDALELPVRFHRLLWLPLYYPETILDFIESGKEQLAKLKFLSPENGGVAGMIQYLVNVLEQSEFFDYEYVDANGWSGNIDPGRTDGDYVISFDETDKPNVPGTRRRKVQLGIVVYESTSSKEKIVTHNLDPETGWFRMSQSLSSPTAVVVELGLIESEDTDQELSARALIALNALLIHPVSLPVILRINFSFPVELSLIEKDSIKVSRERSEYRTNLETKSFNNQVLLGLRAACDMKERRTAS